MNGGAIVRKEVNSPVGEGNGQSKDCQAYCQPAEAKEAFPGHLLGFNQRHSDQEFGFPQQNGLYRIPFPSRRRRA